MKPFNICPSFYSVNATRSLLSKLKDPVPLRKCSGVYGIRCSDCCAFYIGETDRNLEKQILEHISAICHNTPADSAFASHILVLSHSFNSIRDISLIHDENHYHRQKFLKSVEISKSKLFNTLNVVNENVLFFCIVDVAYGYKWIIINIYFFFLHSHFSSYLYIRCKLYLHTL